MYNLCVASLIDNMCCIISSINNTVSGFTVNKQFTIFNFINFKNNLQPTRLMVISGWSHVSFYFINFMTTLLPTHLVVTSGTSQLYFYFKL